jgi:hypothetical protein
MDERPTPIPYHELRGLEGYYFEDGWVLAIDPHPARFSIDIEAVLTPDHPFYGPPKPRQQYRYLRVTIHFPGIRSVEWVQPLRLPSHRDLDGSIDHGNIDWFIRTGEISHLGGEWGEVRITSDPPVVEDGPRDPGWPDG